MCEDCGGDAASGVCDSGACSNDYSCDTQASDYLVIESSLSALGNARGAIENLNAASHDFSSTRLQIYDISLNDNHTNKSGTSIWNNHPSNGTISNSHYNYIYESSVASSTNASSNINHRGTEEFCYNRPRIEISENNSQSTWFCVVIVIIASFLTLLMIACVVLANIPSVSTSEKTSIYSPVMGRPLPQGVYNPISKI